MGKETIEELRCLDIELSDGPDTSKNAAPIKFVIGSDVGGKLMTGKVMQLTCGVTAIETRLGWTLMGEVPKEDSSSLADYAISMFQRDKFDVALIRLDSTKRKLMLTNSYDQYDIIFDEWRVEGIIEEVSTTEADFRGYFIPHRGFIKEGSTTPLRPVFDASSKGKNSVSLNECLEKGPNLIELISSILLRFRKKKIGLVADIKNAFLQISVNKKDRNYLKFLWYDKNNKIVAYRHARVVFGVSCSPFLLGAVIYLHLNRLLKDKSDKSRFIDPAKKFSSLLESFYVDNCVASVNTVKEAEEFRHDAQLAMAEAVFDLRGWECTGSNDGERDVPVLGLTWDKVDDTLRLNLPSIEDALSEKITKRLILSFAHKIYDPVGFACPIMIMPKLLLQQTWTQKVKWDEEIDGKLQDQFKKWLRQLISLKKMRFPRWVFPSVEEEIDLSFHVFCDASKKAYALQYRFMENTFRES